MHRNSLDHLAELATLLHQLPDPQMGARFLRDLLTPSEIDEISLRWELVKRLDRGQSQRAIAAELGLSLCKITRGSRVLKQPGSAVRAVLKSTPARN